jgi:allose kinase
MDIGGTNVRSGFFDDNDGLSYFAVGRSVEIFRDNAPQNLVNYIGELISKDSNYPDSISIGVPSTVDRNNRIIYSTPNINNLDNVPIADMLEEAFHIPCFVTRDVCLLLLHDIYVNNFNVDGFIPGFYIGTGLGNAIAYNGELVTGCHGVAAELGHIPVLNRNDLCGCGNRGCVELYASGKRLAQIRDKSYLGLSIGEVLSGHTDDLVIREFIDNMGAAIATEINILDPENVILGGGVILQEGFPRQALEGAILKYTRKPYPARSLKFIYSRASHENGVIGAALFARKRLAAAPCALT